MIVLVGWGSRGCCRGLLGRVPEDEVEVVWFALGFRMRICRFYLIGGFGSYGIMCSKMKCAVVGSGEKSHDLLGWMDSNEFDGWRLRVWFGAK
jgi:hypothetical protein